MRPVHAALHAAEHRVVDVLEWHVEIRNDLVGASDRVDQLVREVHGVEVHQPNPVESLDLLQFLEQLDEADLAVQIEAVIRRVLCDEVQFAHAVFGEFLRFGNDHLDRLGDVLAAHHGDRTERAGSVAAFADLEVRKVIGRHSQPGTVVEGLDWSRSEQMPLFALATEQVIGHAVDLITPENADDVVDLGNLLQQRRAESLREASRHDHALRLARTLEIEHLANDGL